MQSFQVVHSSRASDIVEQAPTKVVSIRLSFSYSYSSLEQTQSLDSPRNHQSSGYARILRKGDDRKHHRFEVSLTSAEDSRKPCRSEEARNKRNTPSMQAHCCQILPTVSLKVRNRARNHGSSSASPRMHPAKTRGRTRMTMIMQMMIITIKMMRMQ